MIFAALAWGGLNELEPVQILASSSSQKMTMTKRGIWLACEATTRLQSIDRVSDSKLNLGRLSQVPR